MDIKEPVHLEPSDDMTVLCTLECEFTTESESDLDHFFDQVKELAKKMNIDVHRGVMYV